MRLAAPVSLGLVLISLIVSAILWRDLHTHKKLVADLRQELAETRTALAARTVAPIPATVVASTLLPAAAAEIAPAASPSAQAAKDARDALMASVAESARKQKKLLEDAEYRKARLAQIRIDLQQRYASLAVELGLSDREANALFDLMAEQALRLDMEFSDRFTNGAAPDATMEAEIRRIQEEQKKALVALLGPARYEQLEEYGQTQPSRTRVNNLTTLLARSGRPLTNAQTRSLTAVIIAEQKRRQADAKVLSDAGKPPASQPDLEQETNRRILENSAAFLDGQQLELLRGRFQQRNTIDRAADRVQQRERQVLQEPSN